MYPARVTSMVFTVYTSNICITLVQKQKKKYGSTTWASCCILLVHIIDSPWPPSYNGKQICKNRYTDHLITENPQSMCIKFGNLQNPNRIANQSLWILVFTLKRQHLETEWDSLVSQNNDILHKKRLPISRSGFKFWESHWKLYALSYQNLLVSTFSN